MKYIRTKEHGVCKVIREDKYTLSYENSYVSGCLWKDDFKDRIKYSDTIEELSDCFVAVDKNGNLCEDPMIAKGHCFKSFCNYYKAKKIDVDCYLAILTSKGLIFVAKMNEKGEPKLL